MSRRLVGSVLVALIFAGSLAAFTPLAPQYPAATLDSGWAFALNVAVAKGLVFGRDIVFTFGPYAATYTQQYHPATDVQTLWSGVLLGGAFACALMCLSRGAGRLGAVGLAAFLTLLARDALFLIVPFAFVLLVCRTKMPRGHAAWLALGPAVRLTLALLVVALSLETLVKGTFALAAAGALLLGVGLLAVRGGGAVAAGFATLFAGALPLFWALAGQPVAALPQFFTASGPIVSGYTDAMSIPGIGGHPALFLACALSVGLIFARFFARGGLAGAVLVAATVLLLFVAFKAGFVRQDWHVLIPTGFLVAVAWMLALGTPRVGGLLALVIAGAGWAIVQHDQTGIGPGATPGRIADAFATTAHALTQRLTAPDAIPWTFEDSLDTLRAAQPLPKLVGSVDVYSYGQSVLLARDPQWAPRPIVQSYSAYTPDLERRNAAHLAGASAPDNVLFAVQPIDRRLPALEDGLSWPEILARYDFAELRGDLAIFNRRAVPTTARPISDAPIAGGSFQLGQLIPVPAKAPAVWARIAVRPTLLGKLDALAYKPPELTIWYQFADGTERHFRYIPAMGEAGFVVSPLVETTTDFVALEAPAAATYFAGRRPKAIVISAESGEGTLWSTSFSVDFYRLDLPPQPISRALFDRVISVRKRPPPKIAATPDCSIVVLDHPVRPRTPIAIARFLRVVAWVKTSPDVPAPNGATLVLRPKKGRLKLVRARPIPRGDVGGYLDLPPFDEQTYAAVTDLYGAPGAYLLSLELVRDGHRQPCAVQVPIRVARGAAR